MRRDQLAELHFITPISNLPSICQRGILSHREAEKIPHDSVALETIQDLRKNVAVPGGRPLHDYANLYICARNPMLFRRQSQHLTLCVLRVSTDVLDLEGVIITDVNAASPYRRFAPAPRGLSIVDYELTFAEWWTDSDPIQYYRRKSAKCAEVLVPDSIPSHFLMGAYVSCDAALARFNTFNVIFAAEINRHLFFLR